MLTFSFAAYEKTLPPVDPSLQTSAPFFFTRCDDAFSFDCLRICPFLSNA